MKREVGGQDMVMAGPAVIPNKYLKNGYLTLSIPASFTKKINKSISTKASSQTDVINYATNQQASKT